MKLSTLLYLAPLAQACLLPEESTNDLAAIVRRQSNNNTGLAIGTGDRFIDGTVAPRGLGTQAPGTDLGSILSVKEIRSAFTGLAKEYGFETFESPYPTHENATLYGGKIGGKFAGKCPNSFRVFFNAAIHARERGSSDNLLYFLGDLLYANKNKLGLQYGGRTYTALEVRKAISTGIVFIPLSNPDGVAWDQSTNSCWRKNRNPASASPGVANSIGIDLNRNFDFLWDFPKLFTPTVAPNVASNNPAAQTFHGTSVFSEPETQGIKWVMDSFPALRWFLDIHSYTGVVLYNWGSDENQLTNPAMNFQNSSYDSVRGLMPDDPTNGIVYSEYVPRNDWSDKIFAAMRMGNAMDAATGRHYEVTQSAYLYPTSGASDDYAYSRSFADPKLSKIHGYTLEFGFGNQDASCPFYPTQEQYHQNVLETSSGFMEFLLAAEQIGLGDRGSCDSA
ncbi:zinc carboxypeptidase [Amylocarpus encephaloides]|uniref:Zinc carboxypeptidase n=1 Tax=Amylocarpus encephaloides TaxID=45428 RepID=A0A9P7YHM7_9HELO|nr:zinc carboxypeptidase [Amylocarpus encephaloides]